MKEATVGRELTPEERTSKTASKHLKWLRRGRYTAADADKRIGTDTAADTRHCLKQQKRQRCAVADTGKGIEPDVKGCLHG